MHNILCLNNISQVGLDTLNQNYPLTDQLDLAKAILVRSAQMHDLDLPNNVLAVARAGAGVNNIPLEAYAKKGVVVFNTPGANANAVKELIISGMLLASRDIFGGMSWLKENKNDPEISKTIEKAKSKFAGTEIHGKTIGIIGLGAIGLLLAKACNALGMHVIGTDKFLDQIKDKEVTTYMKLVKTPEELYPVCDFLSVNVPLLPDTKHMINKEVLKIMKDGVVILNFARDQLVNETDLKEFIDQKKVRAYVTDFPNATTVHMDGVIAIPHLGASTEEAEDNCALMAIDQLKNYIEFGEIKNSVNFPNLIIPKVINQFRYAILFEANDEILDQTQKAILSNIKGMTDLYFAYKKGFGYLVVDTKIQLSDESLKDISSISGVVKVRNI